MSGQFKECFCLQQITNLTTKYRLTQHVMQEIWPLIYFLLGTSLKDGIINSIQIQSKLTNVNKSCLIVLVYVLILCRKEVIGFEFCVNKLVTIFSSQSGWPLRDYCPKSCKPGQLVTKKEKKNCLFICFKLIALLRAPETL